MTASIQTVTGIRTLPVLILNPYNRCNCRCEMCDIWKRDSTEETSWEEFERLLPEIEALRVQWVVLSGGEPLMHRDLFRFCRSLRDRKIRVTVLSSGLLLERYAEQIIEQVDDLIVSLDGPTETHNRIRRVANAFELLASGLSRIHKLCGRYPVSARCTVQRLNCTQLVATAETAREAGLNSISFLAADIHSTAFNRRSNRILSGVNVQLNEKEVSLLEEQIEALAASGQCGRFVLESPAKLRRIALHFRSYLGLAKPTAPVCNAPWTSAVIESDGSVRPCFFHPTIGILGPEKTLGDLLNGPQATAFRANLNVAENPVCRRCVCSLNWREDAGTEAA